MFIDESFWQAGLWPAEARAHHRRDRRRRSRSASARSTKSSTTSNPCANKLARALRRQQDLGGVERRHLVDEGLSADECTTAIKLEWKLKGEPPLWPGMPPERSQEGRRGREAREARPSLRARLEGGARPSGPGRRSRLRPAVPGRGRG